MGAPEGNDNAREGRRWREAIKRALSREGGDINSGLDRLASKLVNQAISGKPWAIEHIAERMDGRAVQHVSATVEHTVKTEDEQSLQGKLEQSLTRRTSPKPSVQ